MSQTLVELKEEKPVQKMFYDMKDIQQILKISRTSAYALVRSDGFPVTRIGGCIRIAVTSFHKWLEEQSSMNQGD